MTQPKTGDSTTHERDRVPGKVDGHDKRARFLRLEHLDGRTLAARRVKETMAAMEDDLGGADNLSQGQRHMIQRAAVLATLCEDLEVRWAMGEKGFSLEHYIPLINAERRVLTTLGLQRRARDAGPSLSEYLEQRSANAAGNNGNGTRRTR